MGLGPAFDAVRRVMGRGAPVGAPDLRGRGARAGAPDPRGSGALAGAVGVLVAANVLNNRVAPRLCPLTSTAATGVLLALARRSGLSWAELGFHERSRGVRIGGVLASAVAGVYAVGIAVPATRRFFRDERALSLSRARVLEEALLQVPFGTVLLEEVGFRGVLHALVARSYGTAAATVASSALFGLWHVLPAIDMMAANPALSRLASGESPSAVITAPAVITVPDGSAAPDGPEEVRGTPGVPDPPARPSTWQTTRVVTGAVVTTGLAGVLFTHLRRRGGLAAPSMFHLATNSLGYLFARLAPPDRAGTGGPRRAGSP
ncbi:type II CAAX endopeptidase family protein [Streptosporangium fragile]|uniref:Type II CAAX endopeptidase family protein n=1 Tax=Streptosporangium fragile TaxID=46186 RepID=A0ABP6IMN6_9ACTN